MYEISFRLLRNKHDALRFAEFRLYFVEYEKNSPLLLRSTTRLNVFAGQGCSCRERQWNFAHVAFTFLSHCVPVKTLHRATGCFLWKDRKASRIDCWNIRTKKKIDNEMWKLVVFGEEIIGVLSKQATRYNIVILHKIAYLTQYLLVNFLLTILKKIINENHNYNWYKNVEYTIKF